jgi:hypothetical protein
MQLSFFLGQPADPPTSWVVVSVAAKDVMDLVDQFSRESQKTNLAGLPKEAEKVTYRECIRPEITARLCFSRNARGIGEFLHQALSEISSHDLSDTTISTAVWVPSL